jgi:hypothetical protein
LDVVKLNVGVAVVTVVPLAGLGLLGAVGVETEEPPLDDPPLATATVKVQRGPSTSGVPFGPYTMTAQVWAPFASADKGLHEVPTRFPFSSTPSRYIAVLVALDVVKLNVGVAVVTVVPLAGLGLLGNVGVAAESRSDAMTVVNATKRLRMMILVVFMALISFDYCCTSIGEK